MQSASCPEAKEATTQQRKATYLHMPAAKCCLHSDINLHYLFKSSMYELTFSLCLICIVAYVWV